MLDCLRFFSTSFAQLVGVWLLQNIFLAVLVRLGPVFIIIIVIIITTAIELSLDGSNPYASTDKTNKNKYT